MGDQQLERRLLTADGPSVMRLWVRGVVATAASMATLAIAVQFLVIEPVAITGSQSARAAAAREAALVAAVVRAGGVPIEGATLTRPPAPLPRGGGVAAVGDGRLVWMPSRPMPALVPALRWRVLLLAGCGVAGVAGWALWAGAIRRREADRAAQRQVETIGMVAHDLRSPLTGIQLAADRLARSDVPAARVAAQAAIMRECQRLEVIADDILSVCCTTATTDECRPQESISDVLEDVAARVRVAHDCDVIVDASLDARRLRADRQLARAVANVVENAARHSPPGCPVRLRAVLDSDTIEVVVEDAGNGFEPSFRIGAFARGVRAGRAGLGLASSRRILEQLGGSLGIGMRVGGGAAVSLRVPRRSGS